MWRTGLIAVAGVVAGTLAAALMVWGGGPGVFVALGLFVGVWLLASRFRKLSRRAAVEGEARRLGLAFSRRDPFGMLDLEFHPFVRFGKLPGTQGIENVVWGEWDGHRVRACDYWRAAGDEVDRFSCAMIRIPDGWPPLLIRRKGLHDIISSAIGLPDVELELEAFNRLFEVGAADRAFASAVVAQRMMDWLLEADPVHGFQLQRGWLFAWMSLAQVPELERALTIAKGFRDRIPRVVRSLYGDRPTAGPALS